MGGECRRRSTTRRISAQSSSNVITHPSWSGGLVFEEHQQPLHPPLGRGPLTLRARDRKCDPNMDAAASEAETLRNVPGKITMRGTPIEPVSARSLGANLAVVVSPRSAASRHGTDDGPIPAISTSRQRPRRLTNGASAGAYRAGGAISRAPPCSRSRSCRRCRDPAESACTVAVLEIEPAFDGLMTTIATSCPATTADLGFCPDQLLFWALLPPCCRECYSCDRIRRRTRDQRHCWNAVPRAMIDHCSVN